MRLNKNLVTEREKFLVEAFTSNPKMTAAEANGLLKSKYGQMMRPGRVYELRNQVCAAMVDSPSAPAAPTAEVPPPVSAVG